MASSTVANGDFRLRPFARWSDLVMGDPSYLFGELAP